MNSDVTDTFIHELWFCWMCFFRLLLVFIPKLCPLSLHFAKINKMGGGWNTSRGLKKLISGRGGTIIQYLRVSIITTINYHCTFSSSILPPQVSEEYQKWLTISSTQTLNFSLPFILAFLCKSFEIFLLLCHVSNAWKISWSSAYLAARIRNVSL